MSKVENHLTYPVPTVDETDYNENDELRDREDKE